jgi:hypothetical protein
MLRRTGGTAPGLQVENRSLYLKSNPAIFASPECHENQLYIHIHLHKLVEERERNGLPEVGGMRPVRMEIRVVLPAPLGPSRPKNSPLSAYIIHYMDSPMCVLCTCIERHILFTAILFGLHRVSAVVRSPV